MIFITVGTQFPFDRLVRSIDQAIEKSILNETIFAQIGKSSYIPKYFEYVDYLDKGTFDLKVKQADALISHAGIGSLMLAFDYHKPVLLMPRSPQYNEVVNNHQIDTARKFEELGHVLAAYNENELIEKIKLLKTFVPKPRIPNRQGVIDRISSFLDSL